MSAISFSRNKPNIAGLVIVLSVVLLLGVGMYWIFSFSKSQMVSPLPATPSFEVVFYTPTPGITEAVSTPSATPKTKKPTTIPTPSKSAPKATVSPTSKPSITQSAKPSI